MTLVVDHTAWTRVRFGEVVKNVNETVREPKAVGIDRLIAMEHLDPSVLKIVRWGEIADGTTFTRRVRPGQTLFGKRRAYQRKVAFADFDAICSADILVFESDPQRLLPTLLPFFVQSEGFYSHAVGTSAGSLSPRTNWKDLAKYEFDLPPLEQQHRIADLLWAVEREAAATNAVTSAAMNLQMALTERYFVSGDGSATGTLADYCPKGGIRIGPFGAQLHAYDYVQNGEVPVIMPQDMIDGSIATAKIQRISGVKARELTVHMVEEGDILLPRRGELDRRALVSSSEAGWLCGTGSVRVRVRRDVSVEAAFRALSSPSTVVWLKAKATGTTMPNLNAGIVAKIPLYVPVGDELDRALGLSRAAEKAIELAQIQDAKVKRLGSKLRSNLLQGV